MAGISFSKNNLLSLIEHHIALLERFGLKDEAPFSIVYFSLNTKSKDDITQIFKKILRKTDAVFSENDDFIIMLPGTDWNGATELLSGIQEFLSQEPHDNIVTFPDDGENALSLLQKLEKNIEDFTKKEISLIS